MSQSATTLINLAKPGFTAAYNLDRYETMLAGFVVVLVISGMLAGAAPGQGKSTLFGVLALAILMTAYVGVDILDRRWTVEDVMAGRLRTVKGCVHYFHTGPVSFGRNKGTDERWYIAEHSFGYGQLDERLGYHVIEEKGGVVHAGEYLGVAYIISPVLRRKEIMRIDQLPGRCAS